MHSTAPVSEPSPARLFVPVRRGGPALVLRTYVDPLGQATGVGFTTLDGLREVLGTSVEHVELGVNAFRTLLAARGILAVRVDPRLSATPPEEPRRAAAAVPLARSHGSRAAAACLEGFVA